MKYFYFLLSILFWCSSIVTAFADIAVPSFSRSFFEPYPYKKEVTVHYINHDYPRYSTLSNLVETFSSIAITFLTPGPCDYSYKIFDPTSKTIIHQEFGAQSDYGPREFPVRLDVFPQIFRNGKYIKLISNFTLYRFTKEKINATLPSYGIIGKQEHEYKLNDKHGENFNFDIDIFITQNSNNTYDIEFKGDMKGFIKNVNIEKLQPTNPFDIKGNSTLIDRINIKNN